MTPEAQTQPALEPLDDKQTTQPASEQLAKMAGDLRRVAARLRELAEEGEEIWHVRSKNA